MNVLDVALKDLRIFFKDRGAVIQALVLPLIFVVVFSGALVALGAEKDERILLAVVDLDGGQAAQALLTGIDLAGGVRVELHPEDEAQALLDENKLQRVLTIPAGLSANVAENRPTTLRLTSHPDASSEQTEAVRLVVEGVAQDMSLEYQIMASLSQMGEMMASAPEELQVFTVERAQAQARSQFERAAERPLVTVIQRVPTSAGGQPGSEEIAGSSVPGFAVLFVFLTAQTTARSIHEEKKEGTFRRLLASPMTKASLLTGKMLPGFILGLVQTAVIFGFSAVAGGPLGLGRLFFGNAPVALVLTAVMLALCASGLGIVIAAIARTENQIGGFSSLILWVLGALGGSFIPLFILERSMGPIPYIVPHYWANRAFTDVLIRGLGLADVALSLAVLAGFTILFFGIGLWRFDFD